MPYSDPDPDPDLDANGRLRSDRERILDREQASSSRTEQQPTTSAAADSESMATQLPRTATALFENNNVEFSPAEDDDPQAALELLRDALVLLDKGTYATAIQRGKYEVTVTTSPADRGQATEFAVHMRCITNSVVPDHDVPGTTVQTFVTLWIHSDDTVREMVTDHLGANALDRFTPKEEGR